MFCLTNFVKDGIYAFIYVAQVQVTFIDFSTSSLTENVLSEMTIPITENIPSEAQECETKHDSPTDVPKLIISSNCIRLLDVVGQGTLKYEVVHTCY